MFLAAYIALVATAAGAFHYLIHRETAREATTVTFLFTDTDGDRLHLEPTTRHGQPAISLRNARADIPQGAAVHIPLDRVEEVIAGLRDTARQASTQSMAHLVHDRPTVS